MSIDVGGKQVHGSGTVLAPVDAAIDLSAGGWRFTLAPALSDSVGASRFNSDLQEATLHLASPPPVHETMVAETFSSAGGLIGITVLCTHRAAGTGHRLITYTVLNSNAI